MLGRFHYHYVNKIVHSGICMQLILADWRRIRHLSNYRYYLIKNTTFRKIFTGNFRKINNIDLHLIQSFLNFELKFNHHKIEPIRISREFYYTGIYIVSIHIHYRYL